MQPQNPEVPLPTPPGGSLLRQVVGVIVTGTLIASAWLDPVYFPLSLLGISLLVRMAMRCSPRAAFLRGLASGWLALVIAFFWTPGAIVYSTGLPAFVATVLYLLQTFFEALQFAIFAVLVSRLIRPEPRWILTVPAIWVAIEFVYPTFFPWTIGALPCDFLIVQQAAELSGVQAVSFVYLAAATLPVALLAKGGERSESLTARRPWIPVVALSTVLIGAVSLGVYRVHFDPRLVSSTNDVRVGLIQVDPSYAGKELVLQNLSREIEHEVDLICWPETSIGNYQNDLDSFADEIRIGGMSRHPLLGFRPLPDPQAFLLAGGKTYPSKAGENGPYRMTAFLIDHRERIAGRHEKRILMPIGEYVPGQTTFPALRRVADLEEIYEPGDTTEPLRMNDKVRLGVAICFEDMNAQHSRRMVNTGANLLVALVNGSSFESHYALRQHLRLAQARAVENRRWFVRCSATGVTCVISPTGAILERLPCESEAFLIHDVGTLSMQTMFSRCGNWLGPLCLLSTILVCFYRRSSPVATAPDR